MSFIDQSTVDYLSFACNFVIRIAILVGTWLLVIGIMIASHHVFGFLVGSIIPRPTAQIVETLLAAYLVVAGGLMTLSGFVDMWVLTAAHLKSRTCSS